MRRFFPVLVVLLAALLGLPATAAAAANPIGGGSVLFNPAGQAGARCTVAFAGTTGLADYLVAGPGCDGGTSALLYSGNNVLVGPVVGGTGAYLVVKVTNTAAWDVVGWIDTGGKYPIAGSRETPVGGQVCLLNRTTGVACGTVTAKNVTVVFPWGPVTGLTRTDICPQPGSIAYVTGDQAQGVPLSDGTGICTTPGTSYFTPVNQVLAAYGLTLVTG